MDIEQKIKKFFLDHPELWDESSDIPHIQLDHSFKVGETLIDAIFQDADGIFMILSTDVPTEWVYSFPLTKASQDIKKRLLYNLNKMNS